MDIKLFFIFLTFILFFGCESINKKCAVKNLHGKCQSEIDVYNSSLDTDSVDIPILIKEIKNNANYYDDNKLLDKNNKTWIFSHKDSNKILVGGHFIYWNHEADNSNILTPAR